MSDLFHYAKALVERAAKTLLSGELFAKVLTRNDDSGRHGLLIPSDAYSYFPFFPIPDPTNNWTQTMDAFDCLSGSPVTLAYKYYERYPERRITRLNGLINAVDQSPRLAVFLHAKHSDGTTGYYFDCANSAPGGRFAELFALIFGTEIGAIPGNFIVRPVESDAFSADSNLTELLGKFDEVKNRGWIDTLRAGDTGIGYTFETLIGVEENNDTYADFKGIEIKCKGVKEGALPGTGKINLFQAGPNWAQQATTRERIRMLGAAGVDGLFSCYSQVTVSPNNLGLLLEVIAAQNQIDLRKDATALGHWSFEQLDNRLAEKHSRAVFVKARSRSSGGAVQYSYEELIYCDQPSMERFVNLVNLRNIVFEFTMAERPNGSVRNHGYPWRLVRSELLDQLFAFQIKLR